MRVLDDVKQAWRGISSRRGPAAGTLTVLTLGIGLSSVIFAMADPFLWRPLPYTDPDRLVAIRLDRPLADLFTPLDVARVPTLSEWRGLTGVFHDVAAYGKADQIRVTGPEGAASVLLRQVSPHLLTVLGIPSAGEPMSLTRAGGGARLVVLASHTGRRRQPLGDEAIGATLRAEDGAFFQIVASVPATFLFPLASLKYRPDLLEPHEFGPVAWSEPAGHGFSSLIGIARLQPHVSAAAAEAALSLGVRGAGLVVRVEPLAIFMAGGLRPMALGALGAGLLITLLCAANVMGLLVARSAYRAPDFAVRHALGASRVDLLRLIALELAIIGGAVAATSLIIARLILALIGQVIPGPYTALGTPGVTVRVIGFTFAVSAMVLAACVAPVWRGARAASCVGISRAQATDPRGLRWLRSWLVGAQTAVAMVLLVGAAFLGRSYANLYLQDVGLSGSVLVASVSYRTDQPDLLRVVDRTVNALRQVPGVADAAAGVMVGLMLDGYEGGGGSRIRIGGRGVMMIPAQVTPGYFDVTGMTVLAGRPTRPTDTGWNAVVVNQAFARLFWATLSVREVVGQPILADGHAGHVVGVVQDTYDRTLDRKPALRLYKPLESVPRARVSYAVQPIGRFFPEAAVRRAVTAPAPDAIVERLDSISGRLADSVRERSFATLILTLFAISALAVTAAGVFALVAFVVARRTREIAIRMALGAGPRHVGSVVLRATTIATLCGGGAGLAGGLALTRILESQLYGIDVADLPTLAGVTLGFVLLTGVAAWWPTQRALRLDPARALRVG